MSNKEINTDESVRYKPLKQTLQWHLSMQNTFRAGCVLAAFMKYFLLPSHQYYEVYIVQIANKKGLCSYMIHSKFTHLRGNKARMNLCGIWF